MKQIRIVGAVVFALAAIALAACEGDQGPAGPAGPEGPEGPSSLIAWVTVNAQGVPNPAAGFLRDFGGADTDSVIVTRNGAGDYEVRFFGTYAPFGSKHELHVVTTITEDTDGEYVATSDFTQGGGAQADGSEFWTNVNVYKTDDLSRDDRDFMVMVLR